MAAGNGTDSCPVIVEFATDIEHPAYLAQLCLCFLGLFLNAITMAVFFTGKEFKGAAFVFMSALALFDILTLLLKAPECFVLATRMRPKNSRVITYVKLMLYYLWTNALSPLNNITESASVWLTVCLALERYISMRHYSISKTRCTSFNAVIITVAILTVSVIVNFYSFFNVRAIYQVDPATNRSYIATKTLGFFDTPLYDVATWVRAIVSQFISIVLLVLANLCLIWVLQRQSRRMKKYSTSSSSGGGGGSRGRCGEDSSTSVSALATPLKRPSVSARRQMAQRRLTAMLIVVICLVLLGQIPLVFAFHSLFPLLFSCQPGCQLDRCLVYRVYRLLANVPNLLCYSCNFFIYFSLNKHFRSHSLHFLTCGRRKLRRLSGNGYFSTAGPTADRRSQTAAVAAAVAAAAAAAADDSDYNDDDVAEAEQMREADVEFDAMLSPLLHLPRRSNEEVLMFHCEDGSSAELRHPSLICRPPRYQSSSFFAADSPSRLVHNPRLPRRRLSSDLEFIDSDTSYSAQRKDSQQLRFKE